MRSSGIGQGFFAFISFWFFLAIYKFAAGLHYELMPVFGALVLPVWVVGIVMGCASLIQLILDVPAGMLLDKFGDRKLLMFTTSVFILAGIALLFDFTAVTYLITVGFSVVGWLFFTPGINSYVLSHTPRKYVGKFMSFKDIFGSIGIVASTVVLPIAIVKSSHWSGILIIVCLVIALIAIYAAPKDTRIRKVSKKIEAQHFYSKGKSITNSLKKLKELNPASYMLIAHNICSSAYYATIWFVVPLVIATQVTSDVFTVGLGIFDLSIVVLGYFIGLIVDSFGKKFLVAFGLLLFATMGMLTGLSFTWLFLLFGFMATAGEELAGLTLWAWLHSLDKDHAEDGSVAGIITLAEDIGWAIGPVFSGFAYTIVGLTWTIVFGSMTIFITWLFCLYMMGGVKFVGSYLTPRRPHFHKHKH
jgi:MFS family permease